MKNIFIKSALAVCLLGIAMQTKAQSGAEAWVPGTDAEYFIREIDSEGNAGRYLTYNGKGGTASFTATTDIFNQAWRFIAVEGDGNETTTEYYLVSSKIVTEGVASADLEHINDNGQSVVANNPDWHTIRVYKDGDNKFAISIVGSSTNDTNGNHSLRGVYYINASNARFLSQTGTNSDVAQPPTSATYLFSIEPVNIGTIEGAQASIQSKIAHAQAVVDEVEAQTDAGITVFGEGGRYQDENLYTALSSALSSVKEAADVSVHSVVLLENAMYALFATPVISAGDFYLRNALNLNQITYFNGGSNFLQPDGGYTATDPKIKFKFHQSYDNGPVAVECNGSRYYSTDGRTAETTTPDSVVFHYDITIGAYALQFKGGNFVNNNHADKQEIRPMGSVISNDYFSFSIVPTEAGDKLYALRTAITAAQAQLAARTDGEGYFYALRDEVTALLTECEDIWLWKYDVTVEDIISKINTLSGFPASLQFDKNVTITAEKWANKVENGKKGAYENNGSYGHLIGGTENGTVFLVGNYDFSQGLDTVVIGWSNQNKSISFEIYAGHPDTGGTKIASLSATGTPAWSVAYNQTTNITDKPESGILPIYVKWLTDGNAFSIKFAVAPITDLEITSDTEITTISADATYNNVSVASGAALTIASGVTLTVDSISLKSGATLVGDVSARIATVEQKLSTDNNRKWYYLSSPVTEAASTVFGTNKVGNYDETTASYSTPFTEETALEAGRGYVVKLTESEFSGFVTFASQLNNGDISVPVTRSGTAAETQGFNLVGNPYPSYLDWGSVTKDNVKCSFWTRTYEDGAMTFKTYNADSQTGTDDETNAHIAPLQAFWVRVPSEKAGQSNLTLDFTNAERLHKADGDLKLSAAQEDTRQLLRLQVSNGTNRDNAVILFDDRATDAFDSYDSEKMSNNDAVIPEIYTLAGTEAVAINTLTGAPENRELALGFKTGTAGTFGISIQTLRNIDAVTLIDKTDGVEFDLTGGSYEFTSDITDNADRFAVAFRVLTGLQNAENQSVLVYAKDNRIVVKGAVTQPVSRVQVFNVAGQKLTDQTSNNETIVINRTFEAGVYLVKINGETRKIIVK